MAMGQRGRREAEYAISACRPFQNSTGSLRGTRGPARDLGWLSSHSDARRIQALLRRAAYVVWSYETPIAFVSEDDEGNRTAYYVDETHTATTSCHQGIARMGMGEYETIGSETRRDRERENRRQLAQRRQEARVRAMEVGSVRAVREANERMAVVHPAPQARADGFTPEELRAEGDWMPGVASPGYQNGRTEDEQARNLRRLLDSRFADPDWTPFPPLPEDAETRDSVRVNTEERTMDRGWTP